MGLASQNLFGSFFAKMCTSGTGCGSGCGGVQQAYTATENTYVVVCAAGEVLLLSY